jgi:mannose-6-phosphate isomerase-like protein (cupin superfamily)
VRTVRAVTAGAGSRTATHQGELALWFAEEGAATLLLGGSARSFTRDDALAVPAGVPFGLVEASADLRFVEVTLPA